MIQLLGNTNSSLKNAENQRTKLQREVAELTKRTETYDDKIQSMQRAYQSKNEALKTAKYNCELARIDKDKLQSEVEELKAAQCIQKNLKNLQKRVADDAEEHLDKELATAQTQIIVQNLKLREAQTKLEQENKDNIQGQHFKIAELEIKLTQNLGPEYSKQAEFHLQEATRVMDSLKDTLDLDELRHKALKSRKRRMQLVFDDAEPPAKR
ncbi:hypothetical protein L596_025733 [Steinernema carpocapsae]|nr:hypothetical protein L596_025733 [Steinernema carpocapsae]